MTKSGAPKEGTTVLLLQALGKAPLKASDALGLLQAAYLNEDLPEAMRFASGGLILCGAV
jgi:hypothetical protein